MTKSILATLTALCLLCSVMLVGGCASDKQEPTPVDPGITEPQPAEETQVQTQAKIFLQAFLTGDFHTVDFSSAVSFDAQTYVMFPDRAKDAPFEIDGEEFENAAACLDALSAEVIDSPYGNFTFSDLKVTLYDADQLSTVMQPHAHAVWGKLPLDTAAVKRVATVTVTVTADNAESDEPFSGTVSMVMVKVGDKEADWKVLFPSFVGLFCGATIFE